MRETTQIGAISNAEGPPSSKSGIASANDQQPGASTADLDLLNRCVHPWTRDCGRTDGWMLAIQH